MTLVVDFIALFKEKPIFGLSSVNKKHIYIYMHKFMYDRKLTEQTFFLKSILTISYVSMY